ncbi:MAG: hypothetical protein Q7R60_01440, partial [bacterium]|nr:hypothetical protein [bacterium]
MNQTVDQVGIFNLYSQAELFFRQFSNTDSGQLIRYLIILVGGVVGLGLLLVAAKVLLKALHHLTERVVFFELTPPKNIAATTAGTTQLFQVVAGILEQGGWLQRLLLQSPALSFEIVSQKESGIRYLIRVPVSLATVMERTLRASLPGLRIQQAADYLAAEMARPYKVRMLEFKQSRHFAFPLRQIADLEQGDPLAFMTGQMTQLADNELLALQLVIGPTNNWAYNWLHHKLNHLRSLIRQDLFALWSRKSYKGQNGLQLFANLLEAIAHILITPLLFISEIITGQNTTLPQKARPDLVPTLQERELEEQIKTKIDQPLLAATVRTLLVVKPNQLATRQKGFRSSFMNLSNGSTQAL